MRQISITVSETAHWHALIGKAEHISRHVLPHGIEDYLIRLFMRVEQEGKSISGAALLILSFVIIYPFVDIRTYPL